MKKQDDKRPTSNGDKKAQKQSVYAAPLPEEDDEKPQDSPSRKKLKQSMYVAPLPEDDEAEGKPIGISPPSDPSSIYLDDKKALLEMRQAKGVAKAVSDEDDDDDDEEEDGDDTDEDDEPDNEKPPDEKPSVYLLENRQQKPLPSKSAAEQYKPKNPIKKQRSYDDNDDKNEDQTRAKKTHHRRHRSHHKKHHRSRSKSPKHKKSHKTHRHRTSRHRTHRRRSRRRQTDQGSGGGDTEEDIMFIEPNVDKQRKRSRKR